MDGSENTHVYPVHDLKPHDTDSRQCWCIPLLEHRENGSVIVIHNSSDGREITERAVDHAFTEGCN